MSLVLKRYYSIYDTADVSKAINGLDISIGDKPYEIVDYNYDGIELWNVFFDVIYKNKGTKWLLMVEPLVERISKEYDIPMPKIFCFRAYSC